jgi:hypothetical protein
VNAAQRVIYEAKVTGEGNTSDVTVWMKGFIYPRVNSSYQFSYTTNADIRLYISTTAQPENKVLVANNGMVELVANT